MQFHILKFFILFFFSSRFKWTAVFSKSSEIFLFFSAVDGVGWGNNEHKNVN